MNIEPIVFITVRYSFWQRIPRLIHILVGSDLTHKQAWTASRCDHLYTGWERKEGNNG
jgi:hypothetical protein